MEFGRNLYKLKAEDDATFIAPVEIKAPVLVSKTQNNACLWLIREPSTHKLSKKDLSSDEMDT